MNLRKKILGFVKPIFIYAHLLSLLNDDVLASLQDENSTNKIWNKLECTYVTKRVLNQILIRKSLATIKKNRVVSIRNHIAEINKFRVAS